MKRPAREEMIMKKLLCTILTLLVVFSVWASASADAASDDLLERLTLAPAFTFRYEEPHGYGIWPVYSAPSNESYRGGKDNNAGFNTNSDRAIGTAGFTSSGWLMITYQMASGGHRVGYVPPTKVKGFRTAISLPQFDRIPAVAAAPIIVAESHYGDSGDFFMINAGEPFYVLGKYTYYGDWWYVEFTLNGLQSRGFIDRKTSQFYVNDILVVKEDLPEPSVSPAGTGKIGTVTIDKTDLDKVNTRQKPDPKSGLVTAAYWGRSYPCYGQKNGTTGKPWYYIFIEEASAFCWVSSGHGTLREPAESEPVNTAEPAGQSMSASEMRAYIRELEDRIDEAGLELPEFSADLTQEQYMRLLEQKLGGN